MQRIRTLSLMALLVAVCTSCGGYYKILVPGTQTTYYSTDMDRIGTSLTLVDYRTRARVTLTTSEVHELSKEEFLTATAKPKPAEKSAAPTKDRPDKKTEPAKVLEPAKPKPKKDDGFLDI